MFFPLSCARTRHFFAMTFASSSIFFLALSRSVTFGRYRRAPTHALASVPFRFARRFCRHCRPFSHTFYLFIRETEQMAIDFEWHTHTSLHRNETSAKGEREEEDAEHDSVRCRYGDTMKRVMNV